MKCLLDKPFHPVKIQPDLFAVKQDYWKTSFRRNFEKDLPLCTLSGGLDLFRAGSEMEKYRDSTRGFRLMRVFVAVDDEYTIVLPRRQLGDETLQSLIETIRRFTKLSPQETA